MRVLDSIQDFDRRWLLLLQQSESCLAKHRRYISRTADGELYVIVGLVLALALEGGIAFLQHLLIAGTLERCCYWTLKNSLRRKRPAQALPGFHSHIIASDEFSFPSGHSSAAFLFITLLVLHFGPLLILLYVWSVGVALSRIYLGVHFPSDTVIGAILGSAIALSSAVWLLE